MSVCLFVSNQTSKFRFRACLLWPWLIPPLAAFQGVMYFWFCQ